MEPEAISHRTSTPRASMAAYHSLNSRGWSTPKEVRSVQSGGRDTPPEGGLSFPEEADE